MSWCCQPVTTRRNELNWIKYRISECWVSKSTVPSLLYSTQAGCVNACTLTSCPISTKRKSKCLKDPNASAGNVMPSALVWILYVSISCANWFILKIKSFACMGNRKITRKKSWWIRSWQQLPFFRPCKKAFCKQSFHKGRAPEIVLGSWLSGIWCLSGFTTKAQTREKKQFDYSAVANAAYAHT